MATLKKTFEIFPTCGVCSAYHKIRKVFFYIAPNANVKCSVYNGDRQQAVQDFTVNIKRKRILITFMDLSF